MNKPKVRLHSEFLTESFLTKEHLNCSVNPQWNLNACLDFFLV